MFLLAVACIGLTSCAVVRQGEVGVKRKYGRLNPSVIEGGLVSFNPFTTTVLKVPIRTRNQEVRLSLPSKEGLTIESEISILYSIDKNKVPFILEDIGLNYESVLIMNVFRSAAAEQEAQQMEYVLDRERKEAERRKIEAEGTREAQKILAEGLVREIIELRSIEAFRELAKSPNTKIIITDGKTPYLINSQRD